MSEEKEVKEENVEKGVKEEVKKPEKEVKQNTGKKREVNNLDTTRERAEALLRLILICLIIGFTAVIALILYLK